MYLSRLGRHLHLYWIPVKNQMGYQLYGLLRKRRRGKERGEDLQMRVCSTSRTRSLCKMGKVISTGNFDANIAQHKESIQFAWTFNHRVHRIHTFVRTIDGPKITFDDEPNLPKLNNLASHVSECQKKNRKTGDKTVDEDSSFNLNLKRSADLMAAYLKEGQLNPQIIPTQVGFNRLFAAWILDESLSWTTGEAPSLQLLFNYLKIRFTLPMDTTVCKQLAKIFDKLHGEVVRMFTVSKISRYIEKCAYYIIQEH